MEKSVFGLEVADLASLGGVVLNDFLAVGGGDFGEVLAEWHTSIGYDEALVKPRAAEDIEVGEWNDLFFCHKFNYRIKKFKE